MVNAYFFFCLNLFNIDYEVFIIVLVMFSDLCFFFVLVSVVIVYFGLKVECLDCQGDDSSYGIYLYVCFMFDIFQDIWLQRWLRKYWYSLGYRGCYY